MYNGDDPLDALMIMLVTTSRQSFDRQLDQLCGRDSNCVFWPQEQDLPCDIDSTDQVRLVST